MATRKKTLKTENVVRMLASLMALGYESGAVSTDAIEGHIRGLAWESGMDMQGFFWGEVVPERDRRLENQKKLAESKISRV